MNQWIDVEDKLPDKDDNYLVYQRQGNIYIAYCYNGSFSFNRGPYTVTHWMPLPEPPNGGAHDQKDK